MIGMDWQDWAVGIIMGAVALLLLRRLACMLRGCRKGGCSACNATGCPLKTKKKRDCI